ncbi:MAG: arginine--tRNA ligase [Candidatus Limnocylindrales bacterium]
MSHVRSIRSRIHDLIEEAWAGATTSGALPPIEADARPAFEIERPANSDHGDLAANLALKLARPMRRSPLQIAEALAEAMATVPSSMALSEVTVAPPGFLNMRLSPRWLEGLLDEARAAGDDFGRVAQAAPRHFNVEFVSANPTGPLHVGNARGAFVGDLLCRVLEGAGHEVTREYYFNDAGLQIRNLGASVTARKLGEAIPEDGYHGAYVDDLANELPDDVWEAANEEGADREAVVADWAQERVRAGIEASLQRLGVHFDVWKSESSLHDEGWVSRSVERLRDAGHIYEEEGATWFRSTAFGDDKDRVVYRSGGQPTYFASDIGYVSEKFSRGFDKLIYIWGADHHGTVARVRNAAEAMGLPVDEVEMLLVAWVRFVREGVEIAMSKRTGEFLTLDELLEELGVDAARWSFASRAASSPIDVDLELAKKQSAENPVYYVQYAHARISSILAKAAGAGLVPAADFTNVLHGDDVASGLARETLRLPEVVEDGARDEETHGITTYAMELATAFHAFYRDRRVVDVDDPQTSAGRLALVGVTQAALRNALALLGISAPESM